VIAARAIKKLDHQLLLDPGSIVNLTDSVHEGALEWQAPADGGEWHIIVTWDIPTGEKPSLIASDKTCYVIDHLDPQAVKKAYDYLLGAHSGLDDFFGRPLRAVFNDSYEFHTDRMVSPDMTELFLQKNGYDITPYLSSVVQRGYDHPSYLAALYPGARAPFIFYEKENWRIMHDYDVAVNEAFKNNFILTSDRWMEDHGLLHRTQAYGFPGDLIGNAGAADIPEAEQLFAQGSEGYLKLVTSGGHLFHHPLITQESFVSIYRAEMTTPQKIKIWADKSFACGINGLIYHGTPYRYNPGEYGQEGWNTWSSPFMPFINFSTGMNESDPFWHDIKTVNQYLARCQYALRAGRPTTDVLIYMPFIDFTEDQMALNPEEIMDLGYFAGVEPAIAGPGSADTPTTPIGEWYAKLWKTVNELESTGLSWEFVNDDALQKATLAKTGLSIFGNHYQALILSNLPYMELATAKHLDSLSSRGLTIWIAGELPRIQPSFLDYQASDDLVKELMDQIASRKTTTVIDAGLPLHTIAQPIRFADTVGFSRQITREMSDGSLVRFLSNKSDQWQRITLKLDDRFTASYWLDAENGRIVKNGARTITWRLSPYGSVILYASKKMIASNLVAAPVPLAVEAREIFRIGHWSLTAGDFHADNKQLTDWRADEALKYRSGLGIYKASFRIDSVRQGAHYFIDLGKVYFTASVIINGSDAGKRLFAPYSLDITKLIRKGENKIEVQVTTTRRNAFIGAALQGDPHYAQFKGKEKTTLPAGLAGPVSIRIY
jgi:hypothetical protein